MSISLTTVALIVLGVTTLISWLKSLLEWSSENLPKPDMLSTLRVRYKPEECDKEMIRRCNDLYERLFPDPAGEPLERRIKYKMSSLSTGEKKDLIRTLTQQTSEEMGVEIYGIKFLDDLECMGAYNGHDNVIVFSNAYLNMKEYDVEMIKTIPHELKHAVQYHAIGVNGNDKWGYSDETLIAWLENFCKYIDFREDPEEYFLQPVELDSFGFENSVIPPSRGAVYAEKILLK